MKKSDDQYAITLNKIISVGDKQFYSDIKIYDFKKKECFYLDVINNIEPIWGKKSFYPMNYPKNYNFIKINKSNFNKIKKIKDLKKITNKFSLLKELNLEEHLI
jgi:hypothetical protein